MAGALGVFLIETDRTLVDSHLSPLCQPLEPIAMPFLAKHLNSLEPVYVGLF
jgi:hypothetical protein